MMYCPGPARPCDVQRAWPHSKHWLHRHPSTVAVVAKTKFSMCTDEVGLSTRCCGKLSTDVISTRPCLSTAKLCGRSPASVEAEASACSAHHNTIISPPGPR